MKQAIAILLAIALAFPAVLAIETSTGLDIGINVAEFKPLIWKCGERVVLDDAEESWRYDHTTSDGNILVERWFNYAFEGEQIIWDVLVMDKNKIQEVKDVYVVLTSTEGTSAGEFVVECMPVSGTDISDCNARIGEERITTLVTGTMQLYKCVMTVESQLSMFEEYWVNIVAESEEASGSPEFAVIDEDEYWYLNPVVGLDISGTIMFSDVTPGVVTYSNTVLVENTAAPESGVHMDMFIGGQDFRPGPGDDGTCWDANSNSMSNFLTLGVDDNICEMNGDGDWSDTFCYYASHGAYSTNGITGHDAEGYYEIPHVTNEGGILDTHALIGNYHYKDAVTRADDVAGNVLGPDDEVSLTLKLMIPEPCTGSFSDGHINVYGEAI